MDTAKLARANDITKLLAQFKKQRDIISDANSIAIGFSSAPSQVVFDKDTRAYFGDYSGKNTPVFFRNIPQIDEPMLTVAFHAYRAMLLSMYDQKIAALETEFEEL